MPFTVVACDGAKVPAELEKAVPKSAWIEVRSRGPRSKLNARIQSMSGALRGTVADRAADLWNLGAYVYWIDQMVSRGGETDVYGDKWRRQFIICIPVSNPDFWNDHAVVERLTWRLGFVSEDDWALPRAESS
jgi:hypothetical protein